ncbi:mRNA 3' end processing factor [Gurleya vavrai]
MEAIKNILKDTRSSFKIKSNVIVMLAKSNKSQAQQIISFLNENLDDEGKNEIFMKLNNFCEYQRIFEEMKIEIKEERKKDVNVLNIEELNCKEIIEENSKICAEDKKCDNYIPNTNLCNNEEIYNAKKQNIELSSKNNISDLVAEIRRAQALKKEKLKNSKENNEMTNEENNTEKFIKKDKVNNNLDILHNDNNFIKSIKKENHNREIAQDEKSFEKLKQKENLYNKNDLLSEQKNLEESIFKENNKNDFIFENNNSKKEESNIANKKSTIDEKLRESQLNNMILKKRQNFEEITNKKYKNDENYQILNDTNKNSHIKNVSYNKFALQTNKKNFFNVNKLGLPIELSFYKKREHFDNFKSPNFNNFQNTNLSNNKQMNCNIKNNFSPNLFNNKLSPNLYNNNVLFNVNQNCNTLNQNYNNLQNNLNQNYYNLQNNLNRNVHENNKNLNQNYNNLHNNLNQNVHENFKNFNQNINENSNNIINLHENSINNMQMPENKNSFNYNFSSMHENRIKYDPNLLINFLMFILQCNICGLRFNENSDGQSKLVKHVDEHSRQKRILENELNTGREYFSSFFDFINNIAKISIELPKEEEEIQKIKAENANCFICKKRIEKKWCDDDDEWILDDCVMIEDKKYCHRNCVI